MHIGCGIIFLLSWPLFSSSPRAGAYAALGPAGVTTFFSLVGLGIIRVRTW